MQSFLIPPNDVVEESTYKFQGPESHPAQFTSLVELRKGRSDESHLRSIAASRSRAPDRARGEQRRAYWGPRNRKGPSSATTSRAARRSSTRRVPSSSAWTRPNLSHSFRPTIPERLARPVSDRFPSPLIEPLASAPAVLVDKHPAPRTLWSEIRATDWNIAVERFPALEQRGSMVEQFRSLRSRLEEFRAMNRLQSLLVSSGVPQEGKSFIAANLALSLALHKSSKVLLVDGDMRRSTLQEYFGCEAHPGLSDYLSGKCELVDAMQRPSQASTPARLIRRSSITSCSSPAAASATAPRTSPAAPL